MEELEELEQGDRSKTQPQGTDRSLHTPKPAPPLLLLGLPSSNLYTQPFGRETCLASRGAGEGIAKSVLLTYPAH